MKKDMIRSGIAMGVVLVVYHLIAFLVPFMKSGAFWVSYVFTLLAFAMAGAALYITCIRNPNARSKFYGFPIAKIGMIHCVGQLIMGLVVMALAAWVPVWLAVIIYAIALAVVAVGMISG